ncbi:hypothetical protein PIB30_070469, partial [Stylosanthes scabra]|nr:hypothetical protein [Stylosanthes scabra]
LGSIDGLKEMKEACKGVYTSLPTHASINEAHGPHFWTPKRPPSIKFFEVLKEEF